MSEYSTTPVAVAEQGVFSQRGRNAWLRAGMAAVAVGAMFVPKSVEASAENPINLVMTATLSGEGDNTLNVDASQSTDDISGAVLSYTWALNQNYDDLRHTVSTSETYAPGTGPVEVDLQIDDDQGNLNVGTMFVTPGQPVITTPDLRSAYANNSVTFNAANLLANDKDIDATDIANGTTELSFTGIDDSPGHQPQHGTCVVNPVDPENPTLQTITYTPDTNYVGSDSCYYTAQDVAGYESAGQIKIAVKQHAEPVLQYITKKIKGWCATPHRTDGKMEVLVGNPDDVGSSNNYTIRAQRVGAPVSSRVVKQVSVPGKSWGEVFFTSLRNTQYDVDSPQVSGPDHTVTIPTCNVYQPTAHIKAKSRLGNGIPTMLNNWYSSRTARYVFKDHGVVERFRMSAASKGIHWFTIPKGKHPLKIYAEKFYNGKYHPNDLKLLDKHWFTWHRQ